jgi:uncharacterized lipoprotein YddW (UPF0748 family)
VEAQVVRQGVKLLVALLGLLASGLAACGRHAAPAPAPQVASVPPAAPREFRAAWVATVANIDWPSVRGIPVAAQQAEAREIISRARALGLNALILQVRPAADALYESPIEPWSEYLTGTQGQAPEPFYDPLSFWIEEAHRAGLELHAWFNPYRARHSSAQSPICADHVAVLRPDLVRSYGDQLWLDPGQPESADRVIAVVLDVVRRYDVDGVHVDDYFYPYPVQDAAGQKVDFPDEPSWLAYLDAGGSGSRADWRRSKVDDFVERLYREVHAAKPLVRVGVSPFGLGRPDRRPPGVTGFSQYDELYANVERWLEQGWMDYLVPQLYWKMDSPGQPFAPLLDYWRASNPRARHLWPGLFTSRAGAPDPWPPGEIAFQILQARTGPGSRGHAHFSMSALRKDYGGVNELLSLVYDTPALVPASDWLGGTAPPAPSVRIRAQAGTAQLQVETNGAEPPWLLALWARYGGSWRFFVLPQGTGAIPDRIAGSPPATVIVSAIGRTGLESPRVVANVER